MNKIKERDKNISKHREASIPLSESIGAHPSLFPFSLHSPTASLLSIFLPGEAVIVSDFIIPRLSHRDTAFLPSPPLLLLPSPVLSLIFSIFFPISIAEVSFAHGFFCLMPPLLPPSPPSSPPLLPSLSVLSPPAPPPLALVVGTRRWIPFRAEHRRSIPPNLLLHPCCCHREDLCLFSIAEYRAFFLAVG